MPTRLPTHVTDPLACPVCADPLQLHAAVDGTTAAPADGDLAVCIGCTSILQFRGEPLRLHALSAAEVAGLPAETRRPLLYARLSAAIALAERPRKPTKH
jgi:hypothetical protein